MASSWTDWFDAANGSLLLARLEGSRLEWALFIASVVMIAGFWIVLHLRAKREEQVAKEPDGPQSLFVELCAAHRLSETQRNILTNAAATSGVQPPTLLFVDPSVLRGQAQSGRPEATVIRDLGLKLFGGEFEA